MQRIIQRYSYLGHLACHATCRNNPKAVTEYYRLFYMLLLMHDTILCCDFPRVRTWLQFMSYRGIPLLHNNSQLVSFKLALVLHICLLERPSLMGHSYSNLRSLQLAGISKSYIVHEVAQRDYYLRGRGESSSQMLLQKYSAAFCRRRRLGLAASAIT